MVTTEPPESKIQRIEAFRQAKEQGDLDLARTFLEADPRVWYDSKEGEGQPWTLAQGTWQGWDEHFNGVSTPESEWTVEGDRVWRDMSETNDYFRLIERQDLPLYRITYFLAGSGKISGYMISGVPGLESRPRVSREEEFKTWARENDPDELAYLMPDGGIDPTGDRPRRFRALLVRWRQAAGLETLN